MTNRIDSITGTTAGVPLGVDPGTQESQLQRLVQQAQTAEEHPQKDVESQLDSTVIDRLKAAQETEPLQSVQSASDLAKQTAAMMKKDPGQAAAAHTHSAATTAMLHAVNSTTGAAGGAKTGTAGGSAPSGAATATAPPQQTRSTQSPPGTADDHQGSG